MANAQDNSHPAQALQQQVGFAEQNLLQQRRGNKGKSFESMGVIFTGNYHHAIPNNLIFEPSLSPADKLLWVVLRASISNPAMPGYVPSREELCRAMSCTSPTVSRSRTTLRICRWMTYCRSVRDDQQRFVGDVYLLHDDPLSLADTLEMDGGYIRFLEDQVQGNSTSKTNRQLAAHMLAAIERLDTTPRSPTPMEQAGQRIAQAEALQEDIQVKNFNTAKVRHLDEIGAITPKIESQDKFFNTDTLSQDKNFNPADESRDKNFNPAKMRQSDEISAKTIEFGENSTETDSKKFFNAARSSSFCSSSNILNNNTYPRAREDSNPQTSPAAQTISASQDSPLEQVLIASHMGWLVTQTTIPKLFTWELYRANIPVIGRMLLKLGETDRRLVGYQLFGRLIAEQTHLDITPNPIRNIVGFTHRLIQRQAEGQLMLDEWGQKVREAIEEADPCFLL